MGKTLSYQHSKLNDSKGWSLTWKGTDQDFESVMATLAKGFGVAGNVPEYLLQNGFSQAMQDSVAGKVNNDEGPAKLAEYLNGKFKKIVDGDIHSRGPRVDEATKFAREVLASKFKDLDKDQFNAKVAAFVEKNKAKIEKELAARKASLAAFEVDESDLPTAKKAKK